MFSFIVYVYTCFEFITARGRVVGRCRRSSGGLYWIHLHPCACHTLSSTVSSEPLRLLQQNFGGMLVHHDDSDCRVKNRECCFKGQGHSEGSTPEKVTVSPASSVMLHLLQPNLVCWCIVRIDRHVGIRAVSPQQICRRIDR